jgi:hypothetical protein
MRLGTRARVILGVLNILGALTYVAVMWTLVILVPILVLFYVVYVVRTPGLSGAAKALWAVAILAGSVVVMPVFFCLHVLRDVAPRAATTGAG